MKITRIILGLYLLIGGALGATGAAIAFRANLVAHPSTTFFFVGFVVAAIGGFGLLGARRWAYPLAAAALLVQTPAFSLAGDGWATQYWMGCGPCIVVAAPIHRASVFPVRGVGAFGYGRDRWSGVPVPSAVESTPRWVGVNVLAAAALIGVVVLWRARSRAETPLERGLTTA